MIGHEVDEDVDGRAGSISARGHVVRIETTCFVIPESIESVAAHAALSRIVVPLHFDAAAE